jgi:oligoribonuclease
MFYNVLVRPVDVTVALNQMDDFVRNMHTESGLLRELDAGKGVPYRTVEKEVCTILAMVGEPGDFLIAGSGVAQFDQPWLRSHMASIDQFFQYAPYDIGMIRRFVKYTLGRPDLVPVENLEHRSMADLNDFITQARAFKAIFGDIVRPGVDEEV